MSSHHIVREKQEPALLVLGLGDFTDELLGQLLEWSPTLMVTAETAEEVNSLGIKYDVLIDKALVSDDIQSDIKYISLGEHTAVKAALEYLVANGYPAVNVVTDDLDLNDYIPYSSRINIVIFYKGQKIYPVTSGFSKWKQAGEVIEIKSAVNDFYAMGLENIRDNVYQTVSDGFFSLQFNQPIIFIAESLI